MLCGDRALIQQGTVEVTAGMWVYFSDELRGLIWCNGDCPPCRLDLLQPAKLILSKDRTIKFREVKLSRLDDVQRGPCRLVFSIAQD